MLDNFFLLLGASALLAGLVWLPRRNDILTWTITLAMWLIGSNLWKVALIQDHLDSPV